MKSKKKILALLLALVMAFALAACSSGTGDAGNSDAGTSDTGSSDAGNSDAGNASGETIELTFSMHDPLTSNNGMFYENWAKQISEATNGGVNITIFGSGTLASGTDVVDMVSAGAVDIGWVYTSFFPNQYPLTDVITLVLEGFESPVATTKALWDLWEETPEMQAEWEEFQVLNLYGNPPAIICTKDSPVTTVADMAGRSLRCPSGMITSALTAWGASPINMTPGDIYQALEKNNISGCIFEPAGITNFTLQEQLNYYTDMPLYEGPFVVVMNQAKWDSLPAEYQEVIMSFCGREGSLAAAEDFATAAEAAEQVMIDAGGEYVPVSDEAYAEFQAATTELSTQWAESITTDTFDGQAFLDRARELVAQYNAEEAA